MRPVSLCIRGSRTKWRGDGITDHAAIPLNLVTFVFTSAHIALLSLFYFYYGSTWQTNAAVLLNLIKLKDYKDITIHRKLLFEFDFFGLRNSSGDFFESKE